MGNHQVAKRIGNTTASVFYKIGNTLNPTTIIKPHKKFRINEILNDKKALSQDWSAVGKEIEIAIARYGERYGSEPRKFIANRK